MSSACVAVVVPCHLEMDTGNENMLVMCSSGGYCAADTSCVLIWDANRFVWQDIPHLIHACSAFTNEAACIPCMLLALMRAASQDYYRLTLR